MVKALEAGLHNPKLRLSVDRRTAEGVRDIGRMENMYVRQRDVINLHRHPFVFSKSVLVSMHILSKKRCNFKKEVWE